MNTAMKLEDESSPLVSPFIKGTQETFKVQCSLKVTLDRVAPPSDNDPVELVATSPINGTELSGTVELCFSKTVFLGVMEKMLGEKFENIDEIADGAAELLNIIFGRAKRLLNLDGREIQQAIPEVAVADKVNLITDGERIAVYFNSPAGPFHLRIAYKQG